ncbi:MAG: hypothetical protein QXO32_04560 [Candidatus Bathyarchaeia archaeon]
MGFRDRLAKANWELNLFLRSGRLFRGGRSTNGGSRLGANPLGNSRMVKCGRCGGDVSSLAVYCHRCGSKLK